MSVAQRLERQAVENLAGAAGLTQEECVSLWTR